MNIVFLSVVVSVGLVSLDPPCISKRLCLNHSLYRFLDDADYLRRMNMKLNRRELVGTVGAGLGFGLIGSSARAEEAYKRGETFSKPSKMKVGLVTYNLAKDMDVDSIIATCFKAKIQGVELRTTHAHKVEVELSKEQRAEVKKKFQDSPVELMGLGSAFDYHTPDQAKLRKDIEATKEYIILAQDVGASGIKVRPNSFPKEVPREKTLEQIGKSLREVAQFGADHAVQIRLEVHGSETCLLPNIKKMLDIADHPNVGACWNSNMQDLDGDGFDVNFDLVKNKIFSVHMRDLYDESYPFHHLIQRLNEIGFQGYCLAELGDTNSDPVRILNYFRCLWLAYQGLM